MRPFSIITAWLAVLATAPADAQICIGGRCYGGRMSMGYAMPAYQIMSTPTYSQRLAPASSLPVYYQQVPATPSPQGQTYAAPAPQTFAMPGYVPQQFAAPQQFASGCNGGSYQYQMAPQQPYSAPMELAPQAFIPTTRYVPAQTYMLVPQQSQRMLAYGQALQFSQGVNAMVLGGPPMGAYGYGGEGVGFGGRLRRNNQFGVGVFGPGVRNHYHIKNKFKFISETDDDEVKEEGAGGERAAGASTAPAPPSVTTDKPAEAPHDPGSGAPYVESVPLDAPPVTRPPTRIVLKGE
jgi:hypothetical protein